MSTTYYLLLNLRKTLGHRAARVLVLLVTLNLAGCQSEDGKSTHSYAASDSPAEAIPPVAQEPAATIDLNVSPPAATITTMPPLRTGPNNRPGLVQNPFGAGPGANPSHQQRTPPPSSLAISNTEPGQTGLQIRPTPDSLGDKSLLRADLTPDQLIEVLATADHDIQLIVAGRSGIKDPAQAKKELVKIVRMKKEASTRLAGDRSLEEKIRNEGLLGELQALSHLAALGDVGAANQLEQLARKNLSSDNQELVNDSRLVLIGFAMEDLRNGVKDADESLLDLVTGLGRAVNNQNVPALMTMGETRRLFSQYGNLEAAEKVRRMILSIFADSPDQQVASLAAQLAGNVANDEVEKLLAEIRRSPETIDQDIWQAAVSKLADESTDLQTVKYLAGAALECESLGRIDLAQAIYQILKSQFAGNDSAIAREAQVAITAHQARQDAIGSTPAIALPTIDGKPISLRDFRGKVVMMPVWTLQYAPSTSVFPVLEKLHDRFPNQTAIVGLNFHSDPEKVAKFVAAAKFDFPNFRDDRDFESDSGASESSPAFAAQFGIVSLPCVVVIDKQGQVAAIEFLPDRIESTLEKLF